MIFCHFWGHKFLIGPYVPEDGFYEFSKKFPNTLVLATEVKKIYCNELDGNNYPLVINDLEEGFKRIIIQTSHFFTENQLGLKIKRKSLLTFGIEEQLKARTSVEEHLKAKSNWTIAKHRRHLKTLASD